MQNGKLGWMPNIPKPGIPQVVVGTSIGAVNGAAITQGLSSEELEKFGSRWKEKDVPGLPPGMRGLARGWRANLWPDHGCAFAASAARNATSPEPKDFWHHCDLPSWLARRLVGAGSTCWIPARCANTLLTRMNLTRKWLAASAKTLA